MYVRQITSEETYTLAEAKRIIKAENRQKKEEIIYKAKQKLIGFVLLSLSIASPLLIQDATISVIMLPLGIYVLFTKEKVVY